MRAFIVYFCCFLSGLTGGSGLALLAQNNDESAHFQEKERIWEELVEELLQPQDEENEGEWLLRRAKESEVLDVLHELREQPLNLNTATREELLELPFLTAPQVDSLLAYRERIHAFFSLGDLMAIPLWEYRTRRWLSLFAYVGDTIAAPKAWYAPLQEGRHKLVWQSAVPLYLRAGFRPYDSEGRPRPWRQLYLGWPMSNTLRYRHRWKQRIQWGATLQNDSGEPFARLGNSPFDYQSAYFSAVSPQRRWQWWLGDYRIQWGQGLLLGNAFLSSPFQALLFPQYRHSRIRPHTSSDEIRFFRGAAFQMRQRSTQFSAFFSHRWRDGRMENDTLRSWLSDGLHRSQQELRRRRAIGAYTLGARWQTLSAHGHFGSSAYVEHYDHWIQAQPRRYNRHYLRGQWSGGLSADYAWRHAAWTLQGEVATDLQLHGAMTHSARWESASGMAILAQARWFSEGFVAPHAQTLSQSTRIQNEMGVTLGWLHPWFKGMRMRGFVDFFRHTAPTFRADTTSHGLEARFETDWGEASHKGLHLLRYRLRSQQQNIPHYAPRQEWRSTHGLRYQWQRSWPQMTWLIAADVSWHHRQTRPQGTWGFMLSSRAHWLPFSRFKTSAFIALFHTDDHDTRLYAYQPQLYPTGGFPQFAHHGFSVVWQGTWRVLPPCAIGLRGSLVHYFDQQHIGSGLQRIDAPQQFDLGFLLSWQF